MEQNLLSQVRVASVGQEVNVWVFGRTRARLRIGEVLFYPLIVVHIDPLKVSFIPNSSKSDAALFGTNSEVSIAPKMRQDVASISKSIPVSIANGGTKAQQHTRRVKLRALPRTFFSIAGPTCDGNLAYVSPGTFCYLAMAGLPLKSTDGLSPVSVKYLKPPSSPLDGHGMSPIDFQSSKRNSMSNAAPLTTQENAPQFSLRWSEGVPDKHILFEGQSVDVGDWDIWFVVK